MATIEIPSFDFSGTYYPQLLEALILRKRLDVPELTDESAFDPFIQFLRMTAAVGHLNNTLLDLVANEATLPTANLVETVRNMLRLIDYQMASAAPAQADMVFKLGQVLSSSVEVIPEFAQVATPRTDDVQSIRFEALNALTVTATNAIGTALVAEDTQIDSGSFDTSSVDNGITVTLGAGTFDTAVVAGSVFRVLTGALAGSQGTVATNGSTFLTLESPGVGANFTSESWEVIAAGRAKTFTDVTAKLNDGTGGQEVTTWITIGAGDTVGEGDAIYFGHPEAMWDETDVTIDVGGNGIVGVWEYFDGNFLKQKPDSVVDNGPNLTVALNQYLGTANRSGTKIRVTFDSSTAFEEAFVEYVGGVNRVTTTGLIGQTTPSTNVDDYTVGSDWEVPDNLVDGSSNLEQSGDVTYDLPQTVTRNWIEGAVDGVTAFWKRFRIISVAPTTTGVTILADSVSPTGDVNYQSKIPGDPIRVEHLKPGPSTPIGVGTSGQDVTVTLATNGSGDITSTASDVKTAVDGFPAAAALVNTSIFGGGGDVAGESAFVDVPPHRPVIDRFRIDTDGQYVTLQVTQGQLQIDDPLGSSDGSASQLFQTSKDNYIDGSETVTVDSVEWTSVENFLSSTPTDRHYTIELGENDRASVKFGDGTAGLIPAVGVNNIVIQYRHNAELEGNIGANTITTDKTGLSFVSDVFNPRPATGWRAAEGSDVASLERAKIAGPASLRTRGIAIGPNDVETLTTLFEDSSGARPYTRSKAIEEGFGPKTIENVVVAAGGGLATQTQLATLDTYFNGDPFSTPVQIKRLVANQEVTSVNHTPKTIDITAEVFTTSADLDKEQVENRLIQVVHPEARKADGVTFEWDFGETVSSSRIIHEIFEVDASIEKVVIGSINGVGPALPIEITLLPRELPVAGTLAITITQV